MSALVSIIVTVLNEEKTITVLLESLRTQTYPIQEVIVADGGSTDFTTELILAYQKKHPHFPVRVIMASGNRSVGRNAAVAASSSKVIAITDAGCTAHRDWLTELLSSYEAHRGESEKGLVIAGYYDAKPKTAFEEATLPYAFVMPDRVNPETFLPATRSMLLEKKVWEKVGGFNEQLRWNEDYEFAQRLRKNQVKIIFAEKAKVTWIPRETLPEFLKMIFHFAEGDVQAKIWRRKVLFIFARYLLGVAVALLLLFLQLYRVTGIFVLVTFFLYCLWAFFKNSKYVLKGTLWLPVLQITSDFAVMAGSLSGLLY